MSTATHAKIINAAICNISRLDLMADGAHRVRSSGIEKSGVVAVHCYAGCPDGQSRKNVLAVGGVYVLIHKLNTN